MIHISFFVKINHISVHFHGLELMCGGYRLDGDVEPYVLLFCREAYTAKELPPAI